MTAYALRAYRVINAVVAAAGGTDGHHQMMVVTAVATYAGIHPDELRSVALMEQAREAPRLAYSRRLDQIGLTTAGSRSYEAWQSNPVIQQAGVRAWIERARWQEIDGAVIPTGGTITGGRANIEEVRMIAALRAVRYERDPVKCVRCGRRLGPRKFRKGRRMCLQCEAQAQQERYRKAKGES